MDNTLSVSEILLVLFCAIVILILGSAIGRSAAEKQTIKKFKDAGVVLVETKIGDKVEYSVKNISEIKDDK